VIPHDTLPGRPLHHPRRRYGLAQLRGDRERFVFLLGGDGEALFGPDTAQ
jgi:hypothetical protein